MEYMLKLDDFEGPLDLLLHLIKEAKMDIFNIKIEIIANQYLDFIQKMENMNLNIASSYLVMASELIEIKSRLLLPKHDDEETTEEEDPETNLINRLVEYQKYKDITKDLKNLEEIRRNIYTKLPEKTEEYLPEYKLTNSSDITLQDLLDAFQKFLDRQKLNQPLATKVTSKELTVEERRVSIRKILLTKKKINFFELFDHINKEYVIVTFLAILEMARQNELRIVQENNFDNIICEVQ